MARTVAKQAPPPATRTISLALEADLLAEIDAIAVAESRSRARQIAVALRRFAADWHATHPAEPKRRNA